MDFFDLMDNKSKASPLPDRMRPTSLDEFIGQKHILSHNSLLRRAIIADKLGSCIFFGPPGVGKTAAARLILEEAKAVKPDVMILDSIQTIYSDKINSAPGSVTQVRECALTFMAKAKSEGISMLLLG